MWEIMMRLNFRHLIGQPLRTILALAGIIMSVTIFILVPALGNTITESVSQTTLDLSGNSSLEIRPTSGGIDAGVLEQLRANPDIALATPLITSGGVHTQTGAVMALIGVDTSLDSQVRTYVLSSGEMPDAEGEIVLTADYAAEMELELGDEATFLSLGGLRSFTLVGLLGNETGVARMNSGDVAVLGIADALALTGSEEYNTISIIARDGTDLAALKSSLQSQFGDSLIVDSPEGRFQQTREFTMFTTVLLNMVSTIMACFGMVLIYNAIAVGVAQRRSEIGVLRALGMSSRAIQGLYLLESVVLGLIGSFIGVIAGYALTMLSSNLNALPTDFNNTGLVTSAAAITVPWWLFIVAPLFGLLISLIAAFFSSRQIAKVDPAEALVQIRAETGQIQPAKWRVPVALILIGLVLVFRYVIVPLDIMPLLVMMMLANNAIVMTLVALILLYAPLVASLKNRLPVMMEAAFGLDGMLAATNFIRRPKRMVVTGIFLACAIFMGIYIAQSVFGYTDFVDTWNNTQNVGDIVVTTVGTDPFAPLLPLPEDAVEDIASTEGVAQVIGEREIVVSQGATKFSLRAVDLESYIAAGGTYSFERGDVEAAMAAILDPNQNAILVSAGSGTSIADLRDGSTLSLETPAGQVEFLIHGIVFTGLRPQQPVLVMNRQVYQRYWGDNQLDRLTLVLAPDADSNEIRRDIMSSYALRGIVAFDAAEMREAFVGRTVQSIQTVSSLLTTLLIAVLVVGIGSTFYILIIDRRREIGMLRAAGMLPSQIARTVVLEMLILFVIGAVLGVPIALLGHATQEVFVEAMMGIDLTVNVYQILGMLVLVGILTLLAAAMPAQNASKTNILEAMRYE
jgi:putative ABC transport system permease protein